ncbi:endonuclease V [Candidatus Woesearchaeota archaeon]|nr:endonuclease V [Candidatus Woesearchaeota archaeon]
MEIDREKLKKEQSALAQKIVTTDSFKKAELLAGCDVQHSDDKAVCVIVVCDKSLKEIEKKVSVHDIKMQYVPGLLFYRDGPVIIDTFNKLENRPDVLMCPFNGILHPRRLGAASQLGLVLDIPTIGIAKNILCGKEQGNAIVVEKEARATKVMTKEHAKPLYVSPGHKISLKKSVELVKSTVIDPHKLPEPLHIAHKAAKAERAKLGSCSEKSESQEE